MIKSKSFGSCDYRNYKRFIANTYFHLSEPDLYPESADI